MGALARRGGEVWGGGLAGAVELDWPAEGWGRGASRLGMSLWAELWCTVMPLIVASTGQ